MPLVAQHAIAVRPLRGRPLALATLAWIYCEMHHCLLGVSYNRKGEIEQTPLRTKQDSNLEASTFTC